MNKDWNKKIEVTVAWVRQNQERSWAILGTFLLSILFVFLLIRHRQKESSEAWFQLGAVQGQLAQNNVAEARKSVDAWETRFRGSDAGSYEKFLKADLAFRTSDYIQAAQIYGEVAVSGQPEVLRPIALYGQITNEEMSGRLAEAQTLAQSFLDKYPDHYLAAPTYLAQARLAELKGDLSAASAIYERIALLFPQSPWTAMAKTKSQTLAKN